MGERLAYRKIVADHIHTLQQNNNSHPAHNPHPESRLVASIKNKLQGNNAMIARADRANYIVILPTKQYESKIQDFLHKKKITL